MERGLGDEVIVRKWRGTESFKGKKTLKTDRKKRGKI
jgi:hypothetical protein